MALITRRRLSDSPGQSDYRVRWIDNADIEHECYFATHPKAVQFVIATESALLAEAIDMFNAAVFSLSSRRFRVEL